MSELRIRGSDLPQRYPTRALIRHGAIVQYISTHNNSPTGKFAQRLYSEHAQHTLLHLSGSVTMPVLHERFHGHIMCIMRTFKFLICR